MTGAAGGERSRLIRALALSRRFHLYLARCASPRAADELVAELTAELPRLGRAEARLVLLEPYSGRPGDTPLTDGELADRVLIPLLDPPEALRGAIHLVDASRAAYADTDAWARLFALWNEKRNVLGPSRGEVVVMLPAALAPVFAAAAPDVWSIRSGEYAIEEGARPRGAGPEVQAHGSISFVGVAGVALPSLASTGAGRVSGRIDDALLLLRAVPPLALFGGDLVVRPWIEDLLSDAAAPDLSERAFYDRTFYEHAGAEEDTVTIFAQRRLRLAEWELACRQFDAAEALFSELIEPADGDLDDRTVRALSGLAISLAAQGRAAEAVVHADRALSLLGVEPGGDGLDSRLSRGATARALRANALVRWCLGHLERAERLDHERAALMGPSNESELSRVLRLAERGQLAAARQLLRPRACLEKDPIAQLVAMDLEVLAGDLDAALRHLGVASTLMRKLWPAEHGSLPDRCGTALALVEIARGNEERASKLLSRPRGGQTRSSRKREPEGGSRADVFREYTSGILKVMTGDREAASVWSSAWFVSAWLKSVLRDLDEWGRSGLDVRSRLRARLAVGLLGTMVQPEGDQVLASVHALALQAEALLGDTAEDHMSRALAVLAHRDLARRLATAGSEDAGAASQRAAALAEPLGNRGVPAWDALLRATERSP